jgi:hypothetical protein
VEEIPMPNVLGPDRPRLEGQLTDEDAQAQVRDLDVALDRAAGYGQQLWHLLADVRRHLLESLPDPDADTDAGRRLTSPRGPADDAGWDRWCTAYAAVTSALAGPAGDAGWGMQEAHREASRRRGAGAASTRVADQEQIAHARHARAEEQLTDAVVPGHGPDQSNLSRPAR